MTRKTITITITETQLKALAGAVALYEVAHEGEDNPYGDGSYERSTAALDRVWRKIKEAWYA